MTAYRPGQLYRGADGDLLFAILPGDGIEFVTNRGTRVTLAEVERVYAPLKLVHDVGSAAAVAYPAPEQIQEISDTVGNARHIVEFAPAQWAVKPCGEADCVQLIAHGRLEMDLPGLEGDQGAALHLDRATATELARALLGDSRDVDGSAASTYPAPGSEIPDQPGYVVGTCGHRLAASEWRAGFRTCERCGHDCPKGIEQDGGAR